MVPLSIGFLSLERGRDADSFVFIFSRFCFAREDVRQCLYSIADNHSFLRSNRDPIDQMISYLKEYFSPDKIEKG